MLETRTPAPIERADQGATLAEVRRLEAEWRRVLAAVSDCLWTADVDTEGRWTYQFISPVIEAITGRPPEHFLASSDRWMEMIHSDDRAKVRAAWQTLIAGEAEAVYEYRLALPAGSIRWVRSSVRASAGKNGRRLDGVVSDITERKAAEEKLQRSEERFRTLVEKSGEAITLVDAAGIIRYSTPSLEQVTGRGVTEEVGQLAFDNAHPDDRPALLELFARCLAEPNRDIFFETRYRHANGSWRHAEGTARNRLDDPDIQAIIVNFRDVTERREAEARHRDLIEHAPIAIFEEDFTAIGAWMADLRARGVTDLRAYLIDHPEEIGHAVLLIRVLDVNRAAVEQAGAGTKAELLAALPKLFSDQARAGFAEELAALWDGRDEFEYESRAQRLDGGTAHLIVRLHVPRRDGRPDLTRVIVTCTDITARRRAEEACDLERRVLQTVLNAIPDRISRKDADGVYRGCNTAFASFFGLCEEDVIGRTARDFFPAAEADQLAAVDTRLLAGGTAERLELWLTAGDGRRVLYESLRVPLPGPDGRPAGLIGISRDITDRRQLEDQIRQAGKLEAVGQLAGGVAHDFNNLLTAILGNLSLAQTMLDPDHPAREMLAASDQAAWRAAELTRQLLGFARRTTVRLEPADVNASITETLSILRRTIDPRITIDARPAASLSPALADLSQISQVLMNLCLNARDAMPDGGTLTIQTADAAVDAAHARRVATARPGAFVRLTVADTGHGIAPHVRDRIFEPFFTTKELGKGTGLGLALVHGIVTQHRGWIEVDSAPDRGTRFDVYLPTAGVRRSVFGAPVRPSGHRTPTTESPNTETILLVDDELMIRNLGRTILEDQGYRVMLAADGQEAVDLYQRELGRVDLVILDLSMPRLNGRDACRELIRIDPLVRVLLSSGFAPDTAGAIEEPGVKGFVAKPYRPADLTAAIKTVLSAEW
jgi:PAS domain S-box-containing protein